MFGTSSRPGIVDGFAVILDHGHAILSGKRELGFVRKADRYGGVLNLLVRHDGFCPPAKRTEAEIIGTNEIV